MPAPMPLSCVFLAAATLAYRPFLDPLDLHRYWFVLIVPLAFGTAVAYKGVKVRRMETYWRQVLRMTLAVVVAMVVIGFASFVFVRFVFPRLVPAAA